MVHFLQTLCLSSKGFSRSPRSTVFHSIYNILEALRVFWALWFSLEILPFSPRVPRSISCLQLGLFQECYGFSSFLALRLLSKFPKIPDFAFLKFSVIVFGARNAPFGFFFGTTLMFVRISSNKLLAYFKNFALFEP